MKFILYMGLTRASMLVCFQRAAQTHVRMTGRVAWSPPAARRCVTAGVATAGPTAALVSEGWRWAMSCVRTWWMTAGEDMSQRLKWHSVVVDFVTGANRDICVKTCSSLIPERREESCHLCFVVVHCDYCVWGCVCRSGRGVLQQQGHRLQRGGKHHSLWRSVSAVELRSAVRWAARGHRGCLAS